MILSIIFVVNFIAKNKLDRERKLQQSNEWLIVILKELTTSLEISMNLTRNCLEEKKKPVTKKRLGNLDDLFSKNKEQAVRPKRNLNDLLSAANKKPVVSFLDQTTPTLTKRKDEQRKADEIDSGLTDAKNLEGDTHLRRATASNRAPAQELPTASAPSRSISSADDLFGPLQRRSGMARSRTNPNLLETSQPHHTNVSESRPNTQSADDLPFLLNATTTGNVAQPNATAVPYVGDGSFRGYDRIQRLENEVDRLNREIDDLKRKKKEDEEELNNEWKQKLVKKQQEHNEAISELEANHRRVVDRLNDEYTSTSERVMQNLQRQLEAMGVVQNESRKQELVVSEMENLTEQIKQIATQVTTLNEKTSTDRQTTIQIKEEHVKRREKQVAKEEEKLREERKMVDELNIKLQSTFQRSEEEILKEKWHIRDERNRLNAEKNAFKEEQKFILTVIEKHKAETEAARTAFLSEQHDLLVRMFSEKAAFDEEKNAFIIQRDNDIARLKAEAQHLQEKVKQVEDAEKLMVASRQTYQSKYRELIELEQTLFDECVELQQCRAELEASLTNKSLAYNQSAAINEVPFERNLSEVVADPFTDAKSNQRNEDVRTVLKMHADMLDRYLPDTEIDTNQTQRQSH